MGNLLNRKACRDFALRYAQDNRRGWNPERVGRQFLDDLETKVRLIIQRSVHSHPTVGKTIKDLR